MRLNRAVYRNTLRWFLDAPARLIAAGLLALLAYLVVGGMAHMEINGVASGGMFSTPGAFASGGDKVLVLLAWILGAGIVRREISSGAIQLVLLRPITRASYVLSKWAALVSLNLVFLVFCYGVLVLRSGSALEYGDLGVLFAAQAVQIMALSALITALSTVPWNIGELGLLLAAAVLLLIAGHYADAWAWPWLRQGVDFGFKVLFPKVSFGSDSGGSGYATSLVFNAGVTVAFLAAGMDLLGRREFSYAETGA